MSAPLLLLLIACDRGFSDPQREFGEPVSWDVRHPVTIHTPETLGVVDTPMLDVNGTPIGVACQTCHGPDADPIVVDLDNPEDFHGAITLEHGALSCSACHDEADRSLLHLADGTTLAMAEAMSLCAQCHGPQYRDYEAGSHGGMSGYWDLRQGPRTRNSCMDCHAVHQPAYQGGMPVHPPADRFFHVGDH
jgi:formate-dependent nitrite reductase cytochrome c552 subunit